MAQERSPYAENTTYEQDAVVALERLLDAARMTMVLWEKSGLGDDPETSEAAYYAMTQAMSDARLVLGR